MNLFTFCTVLGTQKGLKCFVKAFWIIFQILSLFSPKTLLSLFFPVWLPLSLFFVGAPSFLVSYFLKYLAVAFRFALIALFQSDVMYGTTLSRTLILFTCAITSNMSFINKYLIIDFVEQLSNMPGGR